VRRLTKKRVQWVAALAMSAYGGSWHHDRWPCRHPWKNCRCLGDLSRESTRYERKKER
jgi:hypothetical protein